MENKAQSSGVEFYQDIADRYDEMTRFRQRLSSETRVMQRWLDRYGFRTVLDAACGTGLHAIILAKLGLRVTGADISEAMLARAREHAEESGVSVRWVQSPMQELKKNIDEKFDAVLCLGNSLPHLLQKKDLYDALNNFAALLKPGGRVAIQLLNYQRILSQKQRIVGVNRFGDREYIRFYDFGQDKIHFNILTIHWNGDKNTFSLHTTLLYPYRKDELKQAMFKSGFKSIEFFGDMQFNPYHDEKSPNLVIVGSK